MLRDCWSSRRTGYHLANLGNIVTASHKKKLKVRYCRYLLNADGGRYLYQQQLVRGHMSSDLPPCWFLPCILSRKTFYLVLSSHSWPYPLFFPIFLSIVCSGSGGDVSHSQFGSTQLSCLIRSEPKDLQLKYLPGLVHPQRSLNEPPWIAVDSIIMGALGIILEPAGKSTATPYYRRQSRQTGLTGYLWLQRLW